MISELDYLQNGSHGSHHFLIAPIIQESRRRYPIQSLVLREQNFCRIFSLFIFYYEHNIFVDQYHSFYRIEWNLEHIISPWNPIPGTQSFRLKSSFYYQKRTTSLIIESSLVIGARNNSTKNQRTYL
jgi:hypothetical protein